MKPNDFEIKIINCIKALRKVCDLKLVNIANILNITESNYCKIEKGYKALRLAQLRPIANYFKISETQLIELATAKDQPASMVNPLSKVLIDCALLIAKHGEKEPVEKKELEPYITKILEYYQKL